MIARLQKLKKKKGFTLIELLAVITVLAIIALITVPVVSNSISESRKSSSLRSAELYIDAVDKALANLNMDGDFSVGEGWYNINSEGNICLDNRCRGNEVITVTAKNKPTSGKVYLRENEVDGVEEIVYGDFVVSSSAGGKLMVYEPNAGNINSMCSRQTDYHGYDTVICGTETFYVMNEDSNTVTMLAKYNLDVGYIATSSGGGDEWEASKAASNNLQKTVAAPTALIKQTKDMNLTPIENPTGIQKAEARGYIEGASSYYGVVPYVSQEGRDLDKVELEDKRKSADIRIENQSSTDNKLVASPVLQDIGNDFKVAVDKGVSARIACDTSYTYSDNVYMNNYVENYESYLRNNGLTSVQARLMSLDDIEYLLNYNSFDDDSEYEIIRGQLSVGNNYKTLAPAAQAPAVESFSGISKEDSSSNSDWLFSTSYWLGTGSFSCGTEYAVVSHNNYSSKSNSDQYNFGVRPVIVIDKSEINESSEPIAGFLDFSGPIVDHVAEALVKAFYMERVK